MVVIRVEFTRSRGASSIVMFRSFGLPGRWIFWHSWAVLEVWGFNVELCRDFQDFPLSCRVGFRRLIDKW